MTSAPPSPAQTGKSDGSFQAVLASASNEWSSGSSSVGSGASVSSNAPTKEDSESSITGKQEQAQSPSAESVPVQNTSTPGEVAAYSAEPVAGSDHEKAPAKGSSKPQENSSAQSDGASDTSAMTVGAPDVSVSLATPDRQWQLLGSQSAQDASATDRAAASLKQLNPAAHSPGTAEDEAGVVTASSGVQVLDATAQAAGEMIPASLEMPLGAVLPGNTAVGAGSGADGAQSLGKATQKAIADVTSSKNPLLAGGTGTGADKTAASWNGATNASSHGDQNSGQSSQDSQAGASQTAAAFTPKVVDNGASQIQAQPQVQTVTVTAPAHDIPSSTHTPDGVTNTLRADDRQELPSPPQSDGSEAAPTSGINSAKVIQAMSETEMHVGMHLSDFGDISIRTSVSQQQMTTQISLDHSELSQAISAHISAMQAKLGSEYGLHASIQIDNQGSSFSGDSGQTSQRQQGAHTGSSHTSSAGNETEPDQGISLGMLAATGSGHQLDIRA